MAHKDVDWAYTVPDLTAAEKATLLALAYCRNGQTGKCFPSQKELADMTSFGLATVRRSLDVLTTLTVISRTKTAKGGYRSNDEYTLNHEYEPVITVSGDHSERRSHSPRVVITESTSGDHSEQAVEPTRKQPGNNRGSAARGTRIPDDFTVTPEMAAWARERTPLVDGRHATEKFLNHWHAAAGRNATKVDWKRTWQNWLITDQERLERLPKQRQTPTDRALTTMDLDLGFPKAIAS